MANKIGSRIVESTEAVCSPRVLLRNFAQRIFGALRREFWQGRLRDFSSSMDGSKTPKPLVATGTGSTILKFVVPAWLPGRKSSALLSRKVFVMPGGILSLSRASGVTANLSVASTILDLHTAANWLHFRNRSPQELNDDARSDAVLAGAGVCVTGLAKPRAVIHTNWHHCYFR